MIRSASASMSSVVMPGRTPSRDHARTSATMRPASRMARNSSSDLMLIIAATIRSRREAVEEKARFAVGALETLRDDAARDVVGSELAGVEERLDLQADRTPGGGGGAHHVAGRQVRDSELGGEPLGLGSLARARGAEE